jgi:hypothetical protein
MAGSGFSLSIPSGPRGGGYCHQINKGKINATLLDFTLAVKAHTVAKKPAKAYDTP